MVPMGRPTSKPTLKRKKNDAGAMKATGRRGRRKRRRLLQRRQRRRPVTTTIRCQCSKPFVALIADVLGK